MIEVHFDDEHAVATLRLDRAEARNAIDMQWVEELAAAVERLAGTEGVRALLIVAEGPVFTVGGDIDHFERHLDDFAGELERMVGDFHRSLQAIAELPYPVVAAAQGAVAGGGLGLLWASDVVLLAPQTKLATAFSRLGVSGDGGSSWYLPRLLGLRRATRLLIGGETLTAEQALEWDLVDEVVPAEELRERGEAVARGLAQGPTLVYAEMRRNLRGAYDADLGGGLGRELDSMRRTGASRDATDGVQAFIARRPAEFRGR